MDEEADPLDPQSFVGATQAASSAPIHPGVALNPNAMNLNTILSIPVTVQVVLGSTSLPVASLMKLARGAVVSLDQRVGDPVDIVVNGKTVARGEIVVVDEAAQRFGVSLLEIIGVAGAEQAA